MTNIKYSKDMIAESWCNKNEIFIYAEAITNLYCRIVVNNKGDITVGEKKYKMRKIAAKDDKWWNVIRNLRNDYFDMHN